MGRASVRAAIAAYFAGQVIPNLTTVYRARPKLIPASAYGLSTGNGSGGVLIVHLTSDDEVRRAFGGMTGGRKTDVHQVALEVRFQSLKVDAMAAQDDHDALMDGIIGSIRADRTLGTAANPIWEVGEDPDGIKVEMAEPKLVKQVLKINAVVRFNAWEWVVA